MRDKDLQGIIYAIISSFWISIMLVSVKYLANYYHPFYLVFWRNFLGFILMGMFLPKCGLQIIKTDRLGLFILRAVITAISMSAWFYGLSKLELPYATALSFIAPIFTAIAAIFILGERPGIRRWLGIIIGFLGMLIIIRPGYREIGLATFITLFSTSLWAIVSILIKKLSETESPIKITFYMGFLLTPLTFPLACIHWQEMQSEHMFYFALMALTANFAHIYLSKAFQQTDITTILPFDFIRLVFAAIFSYLIFAESIDIYQIIGSIVIISSSVYIAHREQIAKKRAKLHTEAGK